MLFVNLRLKRTKEGAASVGSWTAETLLGIAKAYLKAEAKAKLGIDLG